MPRPTMDPALKKVAVSYKLSPWIVTWLRKQEKSAAKLIEEALIKTHKLKGPEK